MPVASATGDPHIVRPDGAKFDFVGTPNATYNLLAHGNLRLLAAVAGNGLHFHRLEVVAATAATVVFDHTGLRRVDADGWRVDVWRQPGLAAGEPYLDIHVLERPDDVTGATGLLIDGAADRDPDLYLVAGPPE